MKLLSLGSNQKPSGCLDLAVITAERATNCATEDIGWNTLLDEDLSEFFTYNTRFNHTARIASAQNVGHEAHNTRTTRTNPIPPNERISTVTSSSFFLIGLSNSSFYQELSVFQSLLLIRRRWNEDQPSGGLYSSRKSSRSTEALEVLVTSKAAAMRSPGRI
jgi:hypothetical protein